MRKKPRQSKPAVSPGKQIAAVLMRHRKNVYYVISPALVASGLVAHGFSCRLGGMSGDQFDSLNLSFSVGDDPDKVVTNRKLFARTLGLKAKNIGTGNQVHGTQIHLLRETISPSAPITGDGLITNQPHLALAILTADCLPIMMLDIKRKAIGVLHAGWRGSLNRIAVKGVQAMREHFGSHPSDCLFALGPAIKSCCYQVGKEIISQFQQQFSDWADYCFRQLGKSWSLDLALANRCQLVTAGVPPQNIWQFPHCSSCLAPFFYSYRRQGGTCGRMMSVIMLKN